jgi:hypothetical protein
MREVVVVRHLQRYQTKGTELFLKVLRASVADLAAAGEVKGRPVVLPESPAT